MVKRHVTFCLRIFDFDESYEKSDSVVGAVYDYEYDKPEDIIDDLIVFSNRGLRCCLEADVYYTDDVFNTENSDEEKA